MQSATKTVGEEMLDNIRKISEAMDQLTRAGLPEPLLIMWIQRKTHVKQADIKAVLDALKGINKEFQKPAPTSPR